MTYRVVVEGGVLAVIRAGDDELNRFNFVVSPSVGPVEPLIREVALPEVETYRFRVENTGEIHVIPAGEDGNVGEPLVVHSDGRWRAGGE